MVLGWLQQFDVEKPYAERRVDLLTFVTCGDRHDYAWVRLDPPLEPGDAANDEALQTVLIGPRHSGETLAFPVTRSTHVYVCTVLGANDEVPPEVAPDDVQVRHWAILRPDAIAEPDEAEHQ